LSSQAKLVRFYLASLANNDTQICWPSYNTIAKNCRIARRSVSNALDELEKAGWIERRQKQDSNGKFRNNEYILLDPVGSVQAVASDDTPDDSESSSKGKWDTRPRANGTLGLGQMGHSNKTHSNKTQENNSLESKPSPSSSGEEKAPSAHTVIKYYSMKYEEKYGIAPEITWSKDGANAKRLLQNRTYPQLCQLLDAYFISDDPYICKTNHTFSWFSSSNVFNQLQGELAGIPKPADRKKESALDRMLREEGIEWQKDG